MTIRKLLFSFIFLLTIAYTYQVNAATTGIIDPSNLGNFKVTILNSGLGTDAVINFGKFTTQSAYNITVTSTELRGYAWGEGVGWIVVNCADTTSGCSGSNGNFKVSNTTSGTLSGYAWGENTGWINFGPFTNPAISTVKIDTGTGFFGGSLGATGYAWSQNYGWLQFDCALAESCVETDWRPAVVVPTPPITPGVVLPPPPKIDPKKEVPPPPDVPNPPQEEKKNTGGGIQPNKPPTNDKKPNVKDIPDDPDPDNEDEEDIIIDEEYVPKPDNFTPSQKNTPFKNVLGEGKSQFFSDVISFFEKIGDIPNEAMRVLQTTSLVLLGTLGVIPLLRPGLLLKDLPFLVMRGWNAFLVLVRLRKKVRPWGTVYDSVTKQPLDPAYVALIDENGGEVASAITDIDGRFGFIVKPGKYMITAKKTNYVFPSRKLEGRNEDELYTDLYFGALVEVTEDGGVLFKNIPLDQLAFDWNEQAKKNQKRLTYFKDRDVAVARFSQWLFIGGFAFSLYSFFLQTTVLSTVVLIAYIAMYYLRKNNPDHKIKGDVYSDGLPAAFGIIRFLSLLTGQEVAHKVATASGQYYAILPNGEYKVVVDTKNADGSYTKKESSLHANVTKGFYKGVIRV